MDFDEVRNAICDKIKLFGTPTYLLKQHHNSGLLMEGEFLRHSDLWHDDLICSFKVGYPIGTDGVIAVIQSLTMRRNETTGQCIDYIQFDAKDSSKSNPFCGKLSIASKANDISIPGENFNFGNSFRTKKHKLHVHITIGKEPFKVPFQKVHFKMVFSAYQSKEFIKFYQYTYLLSHWLSFMPNWNINKSISNFFQTVLLNQLAIYSIDLVMINLPFVFIMGFLMMAM